MILYVAEILQHGDYLVQPKTSESMLFMDELSAAVAAASSSSVQGPRDPNSNQSDYGLMVAETV